MIPFCRWGMHLPGPRKTFHRGHLFTRCTDCDTTLIGTAGGWTTLPRGKRVSWRPRAPTDRLFAVTSNSEQRRLRFSLVAALRRARPAAAARVDD